MLYKYSVYCVLLCKGIVITHVQNHKRKGHGCHSKVLICILMSPQHFLSCDVARRMGTLEFHTCVCIPLSLSLPRQCSTFPQVLYMYMYIIMPTILWSAKSLGTRPILKNREQQKGLRTLCTGLETSLCPFINY